MEEIGLVVLLFGSLNARLQLPVVGDLPALGRQDLVGFSYLRELLVDEDPLALSGLVIRVALARELEVCVSYFFLGRVPADTKYGIVVFQIS